MHATTVWERKPTHRRGAHSEMVAAAWAYGQGFDVFRNQAPSGPIDLILVKGRETIRCDVKTGSLPNKQGAMASPVLSAQQRADGIMRITVSKDGLRCILDDGSTATAA